MLEALPFAVGVTNIEMDSSIDGVDGIIVFPVMVIGSADFITDIEVNGANDCVDFVITLPVILTEQVLFAHRGCTRLCITLLSLLQFLSDEELNVMCPLGEGWRQVLLTSI